MKLFTLAHGKLNLALHVVGRRSDGLHLLQMLNAKVSIADELWLDVNEAGNGDTTLLLDGGAGDVPVNEENLIVRAASALRSWLPPRWDVTFRCRKELPSQAGLGGGSSDCAAALRLLAAALRGKGVTVPTEVLLGVALQLGADVPFFLHHARSALVSGVGEEVVPASVLPLSGVEVALVLPPFGLSTGEVFNRFGSTGYFGEGLDGWPDIKTFNSYAGCIKAVHNDLWSVAATLAPQLIPLREDLERLAGVVVGMSGSGSTLFVLPGKAGGGLPLRELQQVSHGHGARVVRGKMLRIGNSPALRVTVRIFVAINAQVFSLTETLVRWAWLQMRWWKSTLRPNDGK